MILLLIPALIAYFGGIYGKIYVCLGIVSLTLDWFCFYKPYFKKDLFLMRRIMFDANTPLNDDNEKFELVLNISFEYMKQQIFLATIQSLGWWIFTSWRWILFLFNPHYRDIVGVVFIRTTFYDEALRAKLGLELITFE